MVLSWHIRRRFEENASEVVELDASGHKSRAMRYSGQRDVSDGDV
jgi:hypothetical protein